MVAANSLTERTRTLIKNEAGEKCTPKDLANEILAKCIGLNDFWIRKHPDAIEALTERELLLLNDQITKQGLRCFKVLGYGPDDIVPHPDDFDEDTGNAVLASAEACTHPEWELTAPPRCADCGLEQSPTVDEVNYEEEDEESEDDDEQ